MNRRVLLLRNIIALSFALLASLPAHAADSRNLNILYISSFEAGSSATTLFLDSFRDSMKREGYNPGIFLENLDVIRLDSRDVHSTIFQSLLAERYGDIRLDVILAQSNLAVETAVSFRDAVTPMTPVFCFDQIDPEVVKRYSGQKNVYGRNLDPPFLPTLRLAIRLFPDADKAVLLVTGASPKTVASYAEEIDALREELPSITFIPLYNADFITAEMALAAAGDDAFAIFLPGGWRLPDGTFLTGAEMTDFFASHFRLPFFGILETAFGSGLVGGSLVDYPEMGREASGIVTALVSERPDPTPWLVSGSSTDMLDYRSLERYGVSVSRIPEGAKVLFMPPSFWIRYESPLKFVLFFLLISSVLLLFILAVRWRENRALRESFRKSMIEAESTRMQTRLLANLNHELNTPLGNALVASSVIAESGSAGEAIPGGFAILERALGEMRTIANDRSLFWNEEIVVMDCVEFSRLLDRMIGRSMAASDVRVDYDFGDSLTVPETHTLLIASLHAVNFLANLERVSPEGRRIRISLGKEPSKNGFQWVLTVGDNSPCILSPSFSVFRVGKNQSEQGLAQRGLFAKLLYLDNKARSALQGSFRLERGADGTNRIVITFPSSPAKMRYERRSPL